MKDSCKSVMPTNSAPPYKYAEPMSLVAARASWNLPYNLKNVEKPEVSEILATRGKIAIMQQIPWRRCPHQAGKFQYLHSKFRNAHISTKKTLHSNAIDPALLHNSFFTPVTKILVFSGFSVILDLCSRFYDASVSTEDISLEHIYSKFHGACVSTKNISLEYLYSNTISPPLDKNRKVCYNGRMGL